MGFTLGLPPGLYLPETQEVNELVEKIKPINGMVMPSYYLNQNLSQKDNNNLVLISNVPIDVTPDDITNNLNSRLTEANIFPQMSESPSFVFSCQIIRSHFMAYVKMISPYVTERTVDLKELLINGNVLPISYPGFIIKDPPPLDKIYSTVTEDKLCVVLEVNSEKVDNVDSVDLPSEKDVLEYFKETIKINRILRPSGYNHMFLYLNSVLDIDEVILNHKNCVIKGIPVTISKSSKDPEECECFIDPISKKRLLKEEGSSRFLTVLSPYMNQEDKIPSISDIFDLSMTLNTIIRKETAVLQPLAGCFLLIFNIVKRSFLTNHELMNEIRNSIFDELIKHGKIIKMEIGSFFDDEPESDSLVVGVEFESPEDAKNAQICISGRRFRGRVVITQIVDEDPKLES